MKTEIQSFYDRDIVRETSRFDQPLGLLEFSTGKHLIEKYLTESGTICDIGAGPGAYSEWLCTLGYEVTVVDMSAELLFEAKRKLQEYQDQVSSYVHASATDLSMLEDDCFDGCLMMGPMYHLTQKDERLAALSELRRVMKPGGVAVVTYFGSYGMLRLGITDMVSHYKNIDGIERFLQPTSFTASELSGFTECYFSTPRAIADEMKGADLSIISYASAQGFAGGMRSDLENLFENNRPVFDNVLDVAVRYCEDERFRDLGQHLHYVVTKA